MKRTLPLLLAVALFPVAAAAQMAPKIQANPVASAVRDILARQSKNLIAAAEEMPADKYSFRPTPQQMTFAHLVQHISGSNNLLCAKISGSPPPAAEKPAETDPKDKLVAALQSSFDYCAQALANVDDSNLGEVVISRGERTLTRAGAMIALTNDFSDHYSMAAIYLRLNGLLPPTAQTAKRD